MKKQCLNPFLPANEYVPDPEPHVFGDRVYVYGSHDRFGAPMFCVNDYVCWSAPADNLADWRYEGVIYRKKQDPKNRAGLLLLFAPDGHIWGTKKGDSFAFDPAVLTDDDGRIWLYSGFATELPAIVTGGKKLTYAGGEVAELSADMKTLKSQPKLLFPKKGKGSFQNHEFFEASSIRKINGRYYFVYSFRHNHELCYAVSDAPDGDFRFGGTLVSNGDIFPETVQGEKGARNYIGNNHGGMCCIQGQWYIFYHRHTNRSSYSRQACAQPLAIEADGTIGQAELTSCGLNGGPLLGRGWYEARICCHLWSREGTGRYDCRFPKIRFRKHPSLTQSRSKPGKKVWQYIKNMRDGSTAGYKYFRTENLKAVEVEVRTRTAGKMEISDTPEFERTAGVIEIKPSGKFERYRGKVRLEDGVRALYFRYRGSGACDFRAFRLIPGP